MPQIRKIAKRTMFPPTIPSREVSTSLFLKRDFPERLASSLTKGALIPFAIRAIIDYRNNNLLSPLQETVVRCLQRCNAEAKLIRLYERLPQKIQKLFDQKYFTEKQIDVDKLIEKTIRSAGAKVDNELRAAFAAKTAYILPTAFKPFIVPYETLASMFAGGRQQPPPDVYNFELSYRGITTLKTDDRSGGVEPYFVVDFCRIPTSGGLEMLLNPFVIKQRPWNLGKMSNNEWMPSGGQQDQNGNPSDPITIFSGDFPPYDPTLTYLSVMKVMEEDGGQGSQIAEAMGGVLVGVGGALIPANAIAGAIVIAIGGCLELVAAIWSSSDEDECIGDLLIYWDATYICSNSFIERGYEVAGEDNDWVMYCGIRSTKRN